MRKAGRSATCVAPLARQSARFRIVVWHFFLAAAAALLESREKRRDAVIFGHRSILCAIRRHYARASSAKAAALAADRPTCHQMQHREGLGVIDLESRRQRQASGQSTRRAARFYSRRRLHSFAAASLIKNDARAKHRQYASACSSAQKTLVKPKKPTSSSI